MRQTDICSYDHDTNKYYRRNVNYRKPALALLVKHKYSILQFRLINLMPKEW